jgi:hypothetical protein
MLTQTYDARNRIEKKKLSVNWAALIARLVSVIVRPHVNDVTRTKYFALS